MLSKITEMGKITIICPMLSKITINKLENQLPYNQKFFLAPHLDNSSNNFKEEKIKKR